LVRSALCSGLVSVLCLVPAVAQTPNEHNAKAEASAEGKQSEQTAPIPPETASVTKHDWTANGLTIHYTATAGNLLLRDEKDEPIGSIFYTAYTADGADPATRPVTFFYNGGPGSATIWLHMGSFGPVRVLTDSPNPTGPPPNKYVPNEYSLLDKSDLVFIDAPLTGFSRAVGKGTLKDFAGTDEDIRAFDHFIVRYITVNQRWNSPKFLFGESYGTTRSAGLVNALANDGVECNGVTLLSSILNYNVRNPGYDTESITYLPSYAAIAWYYKKVPQTTSLKDTVQAARVFARGPYAAALQQGDQLPQAEFDDIATKLAAMTGLSVDYVKQTKLRIDPTHFRKQLLRDQDRTLGRFDVRFQGYDVDSAGEYPGFDPSSTGITGAYVSAFHTYLSNDLKYTSSEPYLLSGPGVNEHWNHKHKVPGQRGGDEQTEPDVAIDLATAIRQNPRLHVFSANGWFDLATPFFGTEYDLSHMMLPAPLLKNVEFGYYPAGHMVYLNVDALKQMHTDMDRFYDESTRQ
jgi:carboxypeptidase C (cathepsin A)